MGCGALKWYTLLAIGTIPDDLMQNVIGRERVRVLHRIPDGGAPFMVDCDNYKSIGGSVDDRIRLMSMVMMYDFTLVICDESLFNEALYQVFREQWEGEYSRRALLVKRGSIYGETEFSRDFPPLYRDRSDPSPLFDMLLKSSRR